MSYETHSEWIKETVEKISEKMAAVSNRSQHKIPYTTIAGVHDDRSDTSVEWTEDNGLAWWTNGFWGGMLWLMYHETKDEKYARIAEISEQKLDKCFEGFCGLHHDVGFMWLPTSVANYRVTGNQKSRARALHAANILAGRFNPAGRFIRAWNNNGDNDTRGWAIIDCMMNIPLLYWASEETGDPRFKHIAMMHADTAMNAFIRPDGSVNHIVEINPFEGGIVKSYGGQGYGEGSSWTRGQSWALYGFMLSYIHTKEKRYLEAAKRVAHYFMANIPGSGLIPVDFRQPASPELEDSTAAAIASCGLIEMAKYVPELERGMYERAAIKMLRALDEKRCNWDTRTDDLLLNCSAAYHDQEHHFSIIYGDYFFMEAIFKLKGNDLFLW